MRRARPEDAAAAVAMINAYASQDLMLPRRLDDVIRTLSSWLVAAEVDKSGAETVVGCGSLVALTPRLAEVRSLAVHSNAQSRGLGSRLVDGLVTLADCRDFDHVRAFTRREAFFTHLGFEIVDRWRIRPKLVRDCIHCPKFDRCDEVAVLKAARPSTARPAARGRTLSTIPLTVASVMGA